MARLYSRTDAGRRAWDTQNTLVPLDCRRVLGFVEKDTALADVGAKLGWSESAVKDILAELEEGGLVKSIDTGPDKNELDFTGNFRVEDIQAALREQSKREERPDLDFTGPLSADDLRAAGEKK
jgi:DNA-binding Lrp family transcriptional regulator